MPGWPSFWAALDRTLKYLAEHGIARVLVAASLTMVIFLSFNVPDQPWQVNVMIFGVVALLGVAGALVRWGEMHSKMFAGRTMVFRCAQCGQILHPGPNAGREPPTWIQCGNGTCGAFNMIQ